MLLLLNFSISQFLSVPGFRAKNSGMYQAVCRLAVLRNVRYPASGKDIVSAGMVEDDIRIDGNKVSFSLILVCRLAVLRGHPLVRVGKRYILLLDHVQANR